MLETILEMLSNVFFQRALVCVVLISIVSATIGSTVTFRGMSFLVSTIAHSSLAGAALAILLRQYNIININPTFGALIFGVLLALFIGSHSRTELREHMEVVIGVAFSLSMSLAILFISMMKEYTTSVWALILGDILLLSTEDIIFLTTISTFVAFIFVLFMREFVNIAFDPEGVKALGVNVKLYEIILLILIASSVVVLLRGIGAILVYAVLIIPPAIANIMGKSITDVILKAFIISASAGIAGILLSIPLRIAPGAIIGLILAVLYLFTSIRIRK
ncbi:MAG: metal ABC transporter permease [Candidatus Korarchaeota archaeon]|nr:metal ABC transporter permease [Thermoproteota archaeon]MCR8463276.1 metal ABC transporter permease [Thermoproteota archaeon]MCR8471241.1 metal ABC transporter permease [Thermoproteota archaeon]MCR8472359.1 metal ABC transporter permease [Thermoproteota archaeon]MCR8473518.1 metal ABC transporter permease [Thermoproteota archaeon]